jgi:hypothetical protein
MQAGDSIMSKVPFLLQLQTWASEQVVHILLGLSGIKRINALKGNNICCQRGEQANSAVMLVGSAF